MLKSIEIIQYRKLKDLTINFNEEVMELLKVHYYIL